MPITRGIANKGFSGMRRFVVRFNFPCNFIGIDYLIGNENFLNKGYRSKLVDLLIEEIKSLDKYHYIIADPIEDNTKSRNLLLKIGFVQLSNGLLRLTI